MAKKCTFVHKQDQVAESCSEQSDAMTFNDLIILAVCVDLPGKRNNYEIYHDNVKLEFDLKSWLEDDIARD